MNAKTFIRIASVAIATVGIAANALADGSQMQLPRVERGTLVTPVPAPTSSTNVPRVENGRLVVTPNVSVAGTLNPPSANVRFPMPSGK
jgi:hypothetical protein